MISFSAHISLLFGEYPYADRPRHAVAAGFTSIETWWPSRTEADALTSAVRATGVHVELLNADGGDLDRGERGFLNDPRRADEARGSIDRALELAVALACPRVHVLVGRRLPGAASGQLDRVVELLRAAAATSQGAGVTLLIEPLNRFDVPGYLAPTPADVAALIDRVGSGQVRMLFDAYHVARSGLDPIATLRSLSDYVGYAQFADVPGRGAPGTGRLDLWRFVDALDAIGYDGPVGLEYEPGPRTAAELGWLVQPRPR